MYLLSALLACNGIDANEAELLFDGLYDPLKDVRDEALESGEDEIDLNLTLGTAWEGDIQAKGTKIDESLSMVYPLTVTLTDVFSPTIQSTINGVISFGVSRVTDQTDGETITTGAAVDGEITVTGDVNGIADLAYSFSERYDALEDLLSFSANGDISGHDVSGFLQADP